MNNCIFCKIANREIPKEFTYEDRDVMVFPDIYPIKPTHLLVVPKKHIADFLEVDDTTLKVLKEIALKIIKQKGLDKNGYRIGINGGGAQAIDHLHVHIIGPMGKAAKM